MQRFHLLIVDDDLEIRSLLLEFLISSGFLATAAKNTGEAEQLMGLLKFNLIILDIMMPKESGIDFLARIKHKHIPVMMLTAMADVDDRINGLQLGAADYLAKPFEVKELILRIKNLLARSSDTQTIKLGPYLFDLQSQILSCNDNKVYLTTNESNLLNILAQKYGQIITREEIISNIGEGLTERTVDAQIARLRNKIEPNPKNPLYLHTIRNKGYTLRET